jgi:hypothetical protein
MGRKQEISTKVPAAVAAFLREHGNNVETKGSGGFGETWAPVKVGETLVGRIVDYRKNQGDNKQDVVTVQDADERLHSVWLTTVLANRIAPEDVGKAVCITFRGLGGKPKRKGWSPAKLFDVLMAGKAKRK